MTWPGRLAGVRFAGSWAWRHRLGPAIARKVARRGMRAGRGRRLLSWKVAGPSRRAGAAVST